MTKANLKLRVFLGVVFLAVLLAVVVIQKVFPASLVYGLSDEESYAAIRNNYNIAGDYSDVDIPHFVFLQTDNPTLLCDVKGYFVRDTVYCIFPKETDTSQMVVTYTSSDDILKFLEQKVVSGVTKLNLSEGGYLSIGDRRIDVVVLFTDLPVLSIETFQEQLVFKTTEFIPSVTKYFEDGKVYFDSEVSKIRVRGNITTAYPKLSYKLKMTNAHAVSNDGADEELLMLANFADPSLLRNITAFEISKALGIDYVHNVSFVEVYLNGEYKGIYAVNAPNKIASTCVDLPPLNDDGHEGTFLLETNAWNDNPSETNSFYTKLLPEVQFIVKNPSNPSKEQLSAIEETIAKFEESLICGGYALDGTHYSELIDVDNFASYYVMNEISHNTDSAYPLSTFLYNNADGKLCYGPVWDYDRAFVDDPNDTTSLMGNVMWYGYLLQFDDFKAVVDAKFNLLQDFMGQGIFEVLDEYEEMLQSASVNNFTVTYIGIYEHFSRPEDNCFNASVKEVEDWLHARYNAYYLQNESINSEKE